ncbi:MAG: protease modulator HflC [Bdellovibrionales bacterium]|jgi:modulator of FtsH protease HflC|nr:protease modulator HflC [Bdellovibrionales bacterium]MBT3526027.1 protease modulator HflC [Bdellovibrionales bacterium]MBT7669022.1 protease modulator HflC [Bdellovibrionales bacterium]MBT7767496.1 protease modulator HflC [Bdellovibrionales bacterium]
MKNNRGTLIIIIVIALGMLAKGIVFVVPEGRQVVITQFGRPVGKPITKAGLHFKKPFVQDLRYVDKRILSWDGFPNQIPTKDKKYIKVDTTARWKIVDALKFIQTVQNERGAKARLDAILDAATRDVISNHNLVEAVRNSNLIVDMIKARKDNQKKIKLKGGNVLEEEITGEIEAIQTGREQLSVIIASSADNELEAFGIKLIDVQLRRISYESSVEKKVYERMISERQRIAQKIRSIGQGEKAKIEGRLTKDLKEIESKAYRKAQSIRGKLQAMSISIYANALNKDPSFYQFMRSMEAYKKSLTGKAKFLLSSDSEFLKYLKRDQ